MADGRVVLDSRDLRYAGLVSIYDERVDLEIDGELVERPRTEFS